MRLEEVEAAQAGDKSQAVCHVNGVAAQVSGVCCLRFSPMLVSTRVEING